MVSFVLLRIAFYYVYNYLGSVSMGTRATIAVEIMGDIAFSTVSQICILFLFSYLALKYYNKTKVQNAKSFAEFVDITKVDKHDNIFRQLGFKKIGLNMVMWIVLLGFVCFIFNIFVSAAFNGILGGFGHKGVVSSDDVLSNYWWGVIILFIIGALFPGLCEESVHRGLLLNGFKQKIGVLNAALMTSLMFGLMHLNIIQFFYTMILGYFMCLAVLAVRSIWAGVIIHTMNNACAVLFSAIGTAFLDGLFSFVAVNLIVYFIFFIGLYFLIVNIIHRIARKTHIDECIVAGYAPVVHKSKTMAAVKFYIAPAKNGEPYKADRWGYRLQAQTGIRGATVLEKTVFFGVLFFGFLITGFTLYWGFL
jgi:membrane protease YdiL (CAAX protease family)